jgi:hypothetical protein
MRRPDVRQSFSRPKTTPHDVCTMIAMKAAIRLAVAGVVACLFAYFLPGF